MSIQTKIIAALLCALTLLGVICLVFYMQVIKPNCIALEEREAMNNMHRVISSVHNELGYLSALNNDWAAWDQTYEFVQTKSEDYITKNIPPTIFSTSQLNLIHFYDIDGKLVWGKSFNLESGKPVYLQDFSGKSLPTDHLLLSFDLNDTPPAEAKTSGIWMTEYGPMLLVSRPIIKNDLKGPVRGALVMGRFFDSSVVEKIRQVTKVDFTVHERITGQTTHNLSNVPNIHDAESVIINRINDSKLEIISNISGLQKESGIAVNVTVKRDVFNRSQLILKYTIITIFLSIIVVFVLLTFFLRKIVIRPITDLTEHVLEIGSTGNLSAKIEVKSDDEIGLLAKDFNAMIDRLHVAKHRIQEQSFQQGMAELASGILHNVRNSLHKMFSNCEQIRKTIDRIPIEKLAKAREELNTDISDEARKIDLTHFLDATNDTLLLFIAQARDQLNRNHPLVEEIERTLKSYEKWAFGEKLVENILIGPLVGEAYQLLSRQYREIASLDIAPEVETIGYVESNRVILIQIIINLLKNAAESIRQMEGVQGRIHVEADIETKNGDQTAHIRFHDNGFGMNNETRLHIFERGFSSKKGENIGLGLHWCRNAIESMNGKIYGDSEGERKGACFHLLLPRSDD